MIPALYDYTNAYNSQVSPSTMHSKNTGLSRFFQRYLMMKAFSVFKFELPEDWDEDFFRYVLFCIGYGVVLQTDRYGVIFQNAALSGFNVYYRPNRALVSNPLLKSESLVIGEDCALIKLLPDYRGLFDLVAMYADMMAITCETFGVNVINSKMSYVFMAESKSTAESMKKLYDQVGSGEPAAFVDKELFNADGSPRWQLFDKQTKNSFIGTDLLMCLRTIENEFDEKIGIDNANTDKRERLTTDEVNVKQQSTRALSEIMLDSLRSSFEKANEMFGLALSVRRREEDENDNAFNYGSV